MQEPRRFVSPRSPAVATIPQLRRRRGPGMPRDRVAVSRPRPSLELAHAHPTCTSATAGMARMGCRCPADMPAPRRAQTRARLRALKHSRAHRCTHARTRLDHHALLGSPAMPLRHSAVHLACASERAHERAARGRPHRCQPHQILRLGCRARFWAEQAWAAVGPWIPRRAEFTWLSVSFFLLTQFISGLEMERL